MDELQDVINQAIAEQARRRAEVEAMVATALGTVSVVFSAVEAARARLRITTGVTHA